MDGRLEQYRIFNTVAERGSFSAAAEKLYVTQSAVSQAVKQLESSLGVSLLIRSPRGAALTQEGEILYGYTSSALELIKAGGRRLAAYGDLQEGELRIAAGDTISSYFLLDKLEVFHRKYPGIKIREINRVTGEAAELVKTGQVDLAFGNLPINDDSLTIYPCLEIHDIFVAGKGFENLKGRLTPEDIAAQPLILLEKKSNSRNYVDAFFESEGCRLEPDIELGAHELLLQFASIGLGVSCVIKEFSGKYLESGEVRELELTKPVPARAMGCCHSSATELSPAAKKFLETVL